MDAGWLEDTEVVEVVRGNVEDTVVGTVVVWDTVVVVDVEDTVVVVGIGPVVVGDIEQDKEFDELKVVGNTAAEVGEGIEVGDTEQVVEDMEWNNQDYSLADLDIVDQDQAFVSVVYHQLGRVET